MNNNRITLYGDGGSRGNPGPSASAFICYQGDSVIHEGTRFLGVKTNNFAEYTCVIMAFEWLLESDIKSDVTFYLDSELITKQIKGEYRVKSPNLLPLYREAIRLISSYSGTVTFASVPREKNSEADKLVNQTLDSQM